MLRLFRLQARNVALCPFHSGGFQLRVSSPDPGDSTLITSAPKSPSSIVQYGPARFRDRSSTLVPRRVSESSAVRTGYITSPFLVAEP